MVIGRPFFGRITMESRGSPLSAMQADHVTKMSKLPTKEDLIEMCEQQQKRIADLERQLAEAKEWLKTLDDRVVRTNGYNFELNAQADRLREALEFYTDPAHYDETGAPGNSICIGGGDEWECDWGQIARQALAGDGGQEKTDGPRENK